MEQRTYTVGELAALLGVSPKDVANAKYAKSKNPMPGTRMAAVRDGMAARGITWEQVVSSPRGKKPGAEAASAAAPVEEPAAPAPVSEPDTDPAIELSDAVTDMEPEDAPPLPPEAESLPIGQAIARELDTWELQYEAAKRLAGEGPIPGSIGAEMSLEDILGALRRRYPGTTVTIPLP